MKRILCIILAIAACFIFTSCDAINELSGYTKISGEMFESRLTELGYTDPVKSVVDMCTQYKCYCDGIEVSLIIANSNDTAEGIYTQAASQLEERVNVHTSLTVGARAHWTGSSSDEFMELYLIEDTLLAIGGPKANKEKIEHIAAVLTAAE